MVEQADRKAGYSQPGSPWEADVLRRRSPWLCRWFTRYSRRHVKKCFHTVRLVRGFQPRELELGPLVVVLNHPSWWDPLMGIVLASTLFSEREHYAPFDATAIKKYGFFEKLGFFGVEQKTSKGAIEFLRTCLSVLSRPNTMVWVTAQGRFADPRERPPGLRPGIGHLAHRLDRGMILPLALEYPFWQERYPEALAQFGEPLRVDQGKERSASEWLAEIEKALVNTQDALRERAVRRDAQSFEILLGGNAGVGGVYDVWRRLKAWVRGNRFEAAHGDDESPTGLGEVP